MSVTASTIKAKTDDYVQNTNLQTIEKTLGSTENGIPAPIDTNIEVHAQDIESADHRCVETPECKLKT